MATPFIVGPAEIAALQGLRDLAATAPVDMPPLMKAMKTADGNAAHMKQMTAQSIELPFGFVVTLSIETNHPDGTMRHMSMSSPVRGRVPSPEAIWMAAVHLGFIGGIEARRVWTEELGRSKGVTALAINLVQPVSVMAAQRTKVKH